ncbi:hypothetical protein ACTMSW_26580 [Micromonospora sp. BQ11]|uniref:hypothetical protein n=1 Tax=Micromonospora sp. BQ11 TaxID=3452212 RepID=UPI003F8B6083
MTRTRLGAAALAVGLVLGGCGTADPAPTAGGAGPAGTAGATTRAGGGDATGQAESGGGGRWCEAMKEFRASAGPLMVNESTDPADVARARAHWTDLEAAAPAEIRAQVAELGKFYDLAFDTVGKSLSTDPTAYTSLGEAALKLETVVPPILDYTAKRCPGLTDPLPMSTR